MIRRRTNNQNIGIATVGGDTYIVQLCSSSSSVGGDANIMTVTRTATTTRHQIKSIFDDKHIGRPMFYVLTRTPRSPFTNFIPQSSCRTGRPFGEAVGLGSTLIANRRHCCIPTRLEYNGQTKYDTNGYKSSNMSASRPYWCNTMFHIGTDYVFVTCIKFHKNTCIQRICSKETCIDYSLSICVCLLGKM